MSIDPELERLYRDVVLEHYRAPRHRAPLASPDARGRAQNPTCGDAVDIELTLDDDHVRDISARALGCSIAVASASILADLMHGRPAADSTRFARQLAQVVGGQSPSPDLDPRLAAFAPVSRLPARHRCALLAWEALEAALTSAK